MKNPILEIHGLYKTYAHQDDPALQNISFNIFENEKVGIVGANGSGKTTLFRCILNIVSIDKGKILLLRKRNGEDFKKYIGFVPTVSSKTLKQTLVTIKKKTFSVSLKCIVEGKPKVLLVI